MSKTEDKNTPTPAQIANAQRRAQVEGTASPGANATASAMPLTLDGIAGAGGPVVSFGRKRYQIAPVTNNKRRLFAEAFSRLHRFVAVACLTPAPLDGSGYIDFAAIATTVTAQNRSWVTAALAESETDKGEGDEGGESGTGEDLASALPDMDEADIRAAFRQLAFLDDDEYQNALAESVHLILLRNAPEITLDAVKDDLDTVKGIRILRCALDLDAGLKASF